MAISDIPGNLSATKKRNSFSDNQSPSNAAGTSIRTVQESPAGTQAQPTRKPYPAGPAGTVNTSHLTGGLDKLQAAAKMMPAVLGAMGGHQLDTGRNALVRAAGGDPETASGGAQKYTGSGITAGLNYSTAVDRVTDAIQPGAAILSMTGAQPAQASSAPSPALQALAGQAVPEAAAAPAAPRASQGLAGQAPAQPAPVEPAGRMLPDIAKGGEWGNAGNGIAGRVNAQGVHEFSDRGADLEAAAGRKLGGRMGDDRGGLSVMTGGREAMERNNRAIATMQQTRLENRNPNYLTTIHDSGASGIQGLVNQKKNENNDRDRAERKDQHAERVQRGGQYLTDFDQAQQASKLGEQQIAQGAMSLADQQRLQQLRQSIADPNAPAAERVQAEQAYQALSGTRGPQSPEFKPQLVDELIDPNDPLKGTRKVPYTFDPRTGQWTQAAHQERKLPQIGEVRGGYRFKGGDPADQKSWEQL